MAGKPQNRLVITELNISYLKEQFKRLITVKFAGDPNKEKRHEFQVLNGLLQKYKDSVVSEALQTHSLKLSRQELKITQQILEATLKGLTEKTIPTYNARLNQGEAKYTTYLAKCANLVSSITELNTKVKELI